MVSDALSFTQGSALAVLAGASQRVGTAASPGRSGGAIKGRGDHRFNFASVTNESRLSHSEIKVRRGLRFRRIFPSQLFGLLPIGAFS
jgi:hypothetical protein